MPGDASVGLASSGVKTERSVHCWVVNRSFLRPVSRSPIKQGISLFGMGDPRCLFSIGYHQVCGKPAADQVGIAPPGGGRLYEVRACEHHIELMVETYIAAAHVASLENSATGDPGQAPGRRNAARGT
jgi:hypothetical protein